MKKMNKVKKMFYKNASCLEKAIIKQIGDEDSVFVYPQDYALAESGVSGFIYYVEIKDFFKEWSVEIIEYWIKINNEYGLAPNIPPKHRSCAYRYLIWFVLEHTINKIIELKEETDND